MILLLDTSTAEARLTLYENDATHHVTWQADRQLAHGLLAWMRDALADQGKAWNDVEGIGVYQGPGSFTGLRIGIAVCNTLADSLGVAIVGATGDAWQQDAAERLRAHQNDRVVLPEYGRDARITTQRK